MAAAGARAARRRPRVSAGDYAPHPVGRVESPLRAPAAAPKQGDEGAPDAWLVFEADVREALRDLTPGDDVFVRNLEAVDGTPVLDVRPVLRGDSGR